MRRLEALLGWLDNRTGFRAIRGHLLDEPLPPGTGWWFTLGSVLLFGLTIQIVTGIALALYYAPTPDHAWDSVRYITTDVRGGYILRGLHHWGASLVVVAAVFHLIRVVFFGSYKKPRELNWIVGLILLQVILALGLTGYLLPWDQRAYWATVVTINISKLTPVVGEWVAGVMRGGADVGALTLTRWYAAHVLVLPAILVTLVVVHLYLMRRHGISGPVRARAGASKPFFPYQAARDLTMAMLVGVLLAALAWRGAPSLEAPADPTASDYIPRPEWYFLGLFQLLKYFPGRWEVIGALVVPGLVMTWLALLPWLDRGESRALMTRRFVLALFTVGLAGVATLTTLGAMDRPASSGAAWTIQEIGGASIVMTSSRCANCHKDGGVASPIQPGRIRQTTSWLSAHVIDPIALAPGLREAPATNKAENASMVAALSKLRSGPPPATDDATRGIYTTLARYCYECHVIDGVGGTEGPDLSRAGRNSTADQIELRLFDPFEVDQNAAMPSFADYLSAEEMKAVATWLAARK